LIYKIKRWFADIILMICTSSLASNLCIIEVHFLRICSLKRLIWFCCCAYVHFGKIIRLSLKNI